MKRATCYKCTSPTSLYSCSIGDAYSIHLRDGKRVYQKLLGNIFPLYRRLVGGTETRHFSTNHSLRSKRTLPRLKRTIIALAYSFFLRIHSSTELRILYSNIAETVNYSVSLGLGVCDSLRDAKCTRPGTDKVFTASANISREECLHAAAAAMEKPNTRIVYVYNVVVAAPHVGAARDVFIRVIVWDRRGLRVVCCCGNIRSIGVVLIHICRPPTGVVLGSSSIVLYSVRSLSTMYTTSTTNSSLQNTFSDWAVLNELLSPEVYIQAVQGSAGRNIIMQARTRARQPYGNYTYRTVVVVASYNRDVLRTANGADPQQRQRWQRGATEIPMPGPPQHTRRIPLIIPAIYSPRLVSLPLFLLSAALCAPSQKLAIRLSNRSIHITHLPYRRRATYDARWLAAAVPVATDRRHHRPRRHE
ncbi:unnamed protein product [Trichogramma brassicae]|uniref:Uncharacterized protein n=1 Tax=Trichogramma brassicae TaxID=86971 RepID=A0A6H5ITL2_9HYME|nr:unnamed protein product [Trichogramma brassicae]